MQESQLQDEINRGIIVLYAEVREVKQMTLEEAIKHCNEVAELLEEEANSFDLCDRTEKQMACNSGKCAAEHRQLAKWLEELKARRAANSRPYSIPQPYNCKPA